MKVKVQRPKDWKKAVPEPPPSRDVGPDSQSARDALEAIRKGNYIHVACMHAGISQPTYHKWMKIGKLAHEANDPKYAAHARFYVAAKKAIAEAEVTLLERVERAGTIDWQPNAWLLERRYNKRWGKKVQTSSDVSVKEVKLPDSLEKMLNVLGATEARGFFLTLAKLEENPQLRTRYEEAAAALEGATA